VLRGLRGPSTQGPSEDASGADFLRPGRVDRASGCEGGWCASIASPSQAVESGFLCYRADSTKGLAGGRGVNNHPSARSSSACASGADPAGPTLGTEWKHTQRARSRVVVQEGPSFWQLAVIDLKAIDYRDSRVYVHRL